MSKKTLEDQGALLLGLDSTKLIDGFAQQKAWYKISLKIKINKKTQDTMTISRILNHTSIWSG